MSAIDKIRDELAAATPGPWIGVIKPNGKGPGLVGRPGDRGTGRCIAVLQSIPGGKERIANTHLAGHAPTYAAALCDLADALNLIMGDGCESYTTGLGSCIGSERTRDAEYTADRWCDSCIAFDALRTLDEALK